MHIISTMIIKFLQFKNKLWNAFVKHRLTSDLLKQKCHHLTKFSSPAALEIVILTTSSAASVANFVKMTFLFQLWHYHSLHKIGASYQCQLHEIQLAVQQIILFTGQLYGRTITINWVNLNSMAQTGPSRNSTSNRACWWPLLELLSWCPICKRSHCNSSEDLDTCRFSSKVVGSSIEL